MKHLFIILVGSLVSLGSFSQEPGFAPINPDFIHHLELIKSQEGTKSPADLRFADIPSPLKLNFSNYKRTGSQAKSVMLPARFDLRDSGFVTPVRAQGNGGTCWAFANIAAIETNWLVTHRGAYDLSEQNLAACNGINRGYNDGGEGNMASAYFTRLSGPLLENDDPYYPPANETALAKDVCKPLSAKPPFYVLTSRFLPADHELIKRTVMQYGGLHISMFGDLDAESYNTGDYTYYNAKDAINWGHGVVIIGWDDNKPVTGGTKSPKGTKGAWIIKNSWGTSFGEAGYFYISYFDHSALSTIVHFDVSVDTDEFEKINMYDDLGASRTFGFGNEIAWGLTRFNAPVRELVKMVGTYVISANSYVDIEIYDSFSEGNLSGLLYSKKNIPVELPGQRVFNVAAEVEGDYYVKIRYNTPAYSHPLPVEAQVPNTIFLPPVIMAPGTNWISSDGEVWESIGSRIAGKEMDLTIRTYTRAATKSYGFFELPERTLSVCDSLAVFAELSDSSINCHWQFLPDGLPMLDSGRVPAKVRFATPGEKSVLLILISEEGIDTIVRSVNISNKLDIEIGASYEGQVGYSFEGRKIPTDYPTEVNKPIRLSVAAGADSFKWSSPYEDENKAEIFAIPDHEGPNVFYVTAYSGSCSGSDTITVDAYRRPENDNIVDAFELHEGRNGPFANYFATVEDGEPSPPTGAYGVENTWCPDGGLQNSIWFWFTPTNDSLKIYADGMYDQFAVYKATLPEDLKNGNNTLTASYDNFGNTSNTFISRIKMTDLDVGEKYWLQFDGGLGGSQEKINIGLYYPKYFYASADTVYLDKDSSSAAQIVIEADSAWLLSRIPNCSWMGFSPTKGTGRDTITVFSKSSNVSELIRTGGLMLKSPYYETKTIYVVQDGTTRIRKDYKQNIGLYPNPVNDLLFIKGLEELKAESLHYVIRDLAGRVFSSAGGAAGNRISVAQLPQGLYFLEIRQGRQALATLKFIKD